MAKIEHQITDRDYLVQENQRLKSLLNALIEKAEQNETKQKKFHKLEFELLNCVSLPELLNKLTLGLIEQFNIDAVSLHLLDPHHCIHDLLIEFYKIPPLKTVTFVNHIFDLENLYNQNFKVQLRQSNPLLSHKLFGNTTPIASFALLPLLRHQSLIGSLHLGSLDANRFSPEMSTDFLQHFSQIAAIALENGVNTDKLKQLTLIDPLTRVKNRRSLYQCLQQEIARADRDLQPLSCMFIDLDYFKRINDRFGHDTGDLALKRLADLIRPNLRASDHLARFGGEEFVVLLPNCNVKTAHQIAERIRKMVENHALSTAQGEKFKMTCSIGITTWNPAKKIIAPQQLAEALIKTADQAVYQAKSNGRNTCHWTTLVCD
jgi:diguanylate cyclase (GGDEF)-like protein